MQKKKTNHVTLICQVLQKSNKSKNQPKKFFCYHWTGGDSKCHHPYLKTFWESPQFLYILIFFYYYTRYNLNTQFWKITLPLFVATKKPNSHFWKVNVITKSGSYLMGINYIPRLINNMNIEKNLFYNTVKFSRKKTQK